jgi:NitT/TauT family transport system permease protein
MIENLDLTADAKTARPERRNRPVEALSYGERAGLAILGFAGLLGAWQLAVRLSGTRLVPSVGAVALGIVELLRNGLLARDVVASLFRVSWGFLLAALVGLPLGLCLGWLRNLERAANPVLQLLRPISPLAWIPIAILGFGVGDASAIFIIFIASVVPLTVATVNATRSVSSVHLQAGRNFGLGGAELIRRVVLPSVFPQLVVALRITLGIAWLVVVAAEMIAVNSGLGFLIVDARNSGNRYDLVVAGMVLIGLVGLALDVAMRGLERGLSFGHPASISSYRHLERRQRARAR